MKAWYTMVVLIAFATMVSSTKYTTYYMGKISTIHVNEMDEALKIKGSESQSYQPVKKSTNLQVIAPRGYNMVISVVYFNLPKIEGQCGDYIEFEGLAEPSDDVEMCGGQSEIAKVFFTPEVKGNVLKITFKTVKRREDFDQPANFEFVITAVRKTGNCDPSIFFKCANKNCIPRIFTCDSYDNCGDNSDEKAPSCSAEIGSKEDSFEEPGLSVFGLIAIISSSFIGLVLLASIIIYKCRQRPSLNAGELSRISTVEGQLHRSASYNSTPIPNNPRSPASTSQVNPPYSPYYENDGYQPYQDVESAPPPYEEAVSTKS